MTTVKINCPICNKKGIIEVSSEAMKNVSKGLLAINISNGIVCSHSFMAYIDNNFNVRDYFTPDFQVEIPEITLVEEVQSSKTLTKEIADIDLIKYNFTFTLLTFILRSIFSKQHIVLISNQPFLYDHIRNFFNFLTQDTFDVKISIISSKDYQKNKKGYKNAMIFENNNIINNNKNLINPKKLLIEKDIIGKFLYEQEQGSSFIILKNEIQKAYGLSKSIVDIIAKEKEKGIQINMLKIQKDLEEKYNIKINTLYLKFLIDIVINYFEIPVPKLIDGFFNFL